MPNITLRGVPEEAMGRLRTLAAAERRSLNGEILVVIERGLERTEETRREPSVGAAVQARLWAGLCGRWEDPRDWTRIAADIVGRRTAGRKVAL